MFRIWCIFIGYCIGCIQSAYIIGRLIGHIDIRKEGSGNAGTTNVVRTLGAKAGAVVFAGDILKGLIGFCVCSLIFRGGGSFFGEGSLLPGIYGGAGVILGHDFPFYIGFRGGKGIASFVGIIFCISIKAAVITYLIGILIVAATKYISVCSLAMTLVYPLIMLAWGFEYEAAIVMLAAAALAWYQHRSNIRRLLRGEENKFRLIKK